MYAVFLLVPMMVAAVSAAESGYTTKFDNVDLDEILRNDRLLKNYFQCLMEKGPCTPAGKELQKNLPDALENDCAKCSEKQKTGAEKVLRFMYEKKQDMFKELEAKYDPDNKYRNKYKERIEQAGVKL